MSLQHLPPAPEIINDQLLARLTVEGLISKEDAATWPLRRETERKSILELAHLEETIDQERLTQIAAELVGVPYVDLRSMTIDKQALNILPDTIAQSDRMIVYALQEKVASVALYDPTDYRAISALEFIAGKQGIDFAPALMSRESFRTALRQYGSLTSEIGEALEATSSESLDTIIEEEVETPRTTEAVVSDAPISKAVAVILKHAVEGGASDIHIEPLEDKTVVRYRVDGVLHTSITLPRKLHPSVVARIKILADLKIDEQRLPQDGRFNANFEGDKYDFRVSTLPTVFGEKVVLRILDRGQKLATLEDLGVRGGHLKLIKEAISRPHGMFLVTGPTGSGKSTTLYAVLSLLNRDNVNIVTLEDPVEYLLPGVNQSQVNPDIGLTFASGLRSLLRQDPDIMMVGEIRDTETAELAVHSALTGHIVLSTLHTNTALGAIPRMTDLGVEPFLLVSSVNMLVAQRLVRRICRACKEVISNPPQDALNYIRAALETLPEDLKQETKDLPIAMYHGKGCQVCGNTGFIGRIGVFEVVPLTDALQQMVLLKKSDAEMDREARSQGFISMLQDGMLKVLTGETTIDEIIRIIKE